MNLEWVFKNCILTFIAFTCKPEIQFIPLRSVGSTESTDACLTCIFAFWVRRKKKMTHAQEHAPPSTNSLCRLKQVSPKVAVFKNINGVKIKLIQTLFFSHAWPEFSWYTRKFGSPTEGSSSMNEDFGEPEGKWYWDWQAVLCVLFMLTAI